MLSESHPLIRRALRFLALPYCYVSLVNWRECTASKYQVLKDMFFIFFKLKYFPDNYSPCRFWEKDRRLWSYYYGSGYEPYQRNKLRKEVQRREYLIMFDDKEVCELLCRGINNIKMPDFYGVITTDMDYRSSIKNILKNISDKEIIIKPTMGSAGRNIAIAFYKDEKIKVKIGDKTKSLEEFKIEEKSIMQELVRQNEKIASIAKDSVNTIRVVTLYTKTNKAIIISASMRFGVGKSHIDNWSAGGIAVGIDHNKGVLKKIAYDKKGKQYTKHPVSNIVFDGFQIPEWDKIVDMAINIQTACSFFKLLGMDIAVSKTGPVLIEVNPSTDLVFQEQTAGPLLQDIVVRKEFEKYDLLINRYQKSLI